MARKSTPKPEGASEATESAADSITKAEAIRRTLAEGITSAEEGVAHIKTHYGLDVTRGHFAASKSREKPPGTPPAKRGRPVVAKVPAKRGRKPRAGVEGYLAPPPKGGTSDDVLETLEVLKPLIAQHGAERLKRLVDLLG